MSLEQRIKDRNINRICHFTKSKSFLNMLMDSNFIYSVKQMERDTIDINDENRFDNHLDHINCSIQYPNIYYLERIRDKDLLFKDWVVLILDPKVLCKENTLVSPVNAATKNGHYIEDIHTGLDKLYENEIKSKHMCNRTLFTPNNVPTDLQAEVLIYQKIELEYIMGILVPNEMQAKKEYARLKALGLENRFKIWFSEDIFAKSKLAKQLKQGIIPEETLYIGGN